MKITEEEVRQMAEDQRATFINKLALEWQTKGGKMGANGLDWAILDYAFDTFFNFNMKIVEAE